MSSKQLALKDYVDLKDLVIEGEITSIQNNISNINGDILNLENNVSTLSGNVQNIEQDISIISNEIININQDLISLSAEVDTKVDILNGYSISQDLSGALIQDKLSFTPISNLTTIAQGDLVYNADEHTLSFGVEDGSIEIGKEVVDCYTNLAGVTLVDGDIVSSIGVAGGRQAVALTDIRNSQSGSACIGMVTNGAAPNGLVRVTKIGRVHGLNTQGFTEGLPIYVDPNNPGKLTQTPPTAPNTFIHVGLVEVAQQNNGIIGVDLRVSPRFQDLSDVDGIPLSASGQFAVWHPELSAFDFDKNINSYALTSTVNNLSNSLSSYALQTFVTSSISAHNISGIAHQDIRNLVTNVSNSLSGYVPYTGATTDVNLGSYNLSADMIYTMGNVNIGGNLNITDSLSCGGALSGVSTVEAGLIVNNGQTGNDIDDFIVKTQNNSTAFVVDASENTISLGTSAFTKNLTINGSLSLSASNIYTGNVTGTNIYLTLSIGTSSFLLPLYKTI